MLPPCSAASRCCAPEPMRTTAVTRADRKRYARARARGRARTQGASAVVDAHYDKSRDRVELMFDGGSAISIPRNMIPGLERASTSKLDAILVSPAGDALSWPSLDVDVYVPGLVERVFGSHLFTVTTRRRG